MAKSTMNRPTPIFEGVDIVPSEEEKKTKTPKYPPSVRIRKVANGYIAAKMGGELSDEMYYEDKEFIFKTAEEAVKSCGSFLETGKASYKKGD